jgi:hypothetical protein
MKGKAVRITHGGRSNGPKPKLADTDALKLKPFMDREPRGANRTQPCIGKVGCIGRGRVLTSNYERRSYLRSKTEVSSAFQHDKI